MKRVYIADSLADAHLLCSRLGTIGVKAHVFNEFANGAVGELPFTHTWPEVWLEHDHDEESAMLAVEAHCRRNDSDEETSCEACGELNPANFEICWSCEAELRHS